MFEWKKVHATVKPWRKIYFFEAVAHPVWANLSGYKVQAVPWKNYGTKKNTVDGNPKNSHKKNYDMDNLTQKYLLYKQFVFWYCNGCSTAHLTECINNPIYHKLIEKKACDQNKSDERIY